MIDFLKISKKDQEQLLFDLFSIIDFTRSIIGGSYYKNLNVIILNIMGEFAATKGFISVREKNNFKVSAHKGKIDIKTINNFLNENNFEKDATVLSDSILSEIDCKLLIAIKRENILGYIGLDGDMVLDIYNRKKDFYLNAFINIASLVIDNELLYKEQTDLNKQLEQKIYQLKTIFDISAELNMQIEETQILDITLHTIIGHYLISKAIIYTYDDKSVLNILIRGIKEKSDIKAFFNDKSYVKYLKEHELIYLGDNNNEDLEFFQPIREQNISYIFPLKFKDKLLGAVLLGKKMGIYPLSQQDIDFLKTLLTQALVEILNIRLFQEYTEKTIMEREISLAKQIQQRLLPKETPHIAGYSTATLITQCNDLGGDFYNIFRLDDGKYAFLVGDVSGKGIPAALIMSNIQALVQAIFTENTDINYGMQRINQLLFESTEQNRYATLIFLILNPDKNTLYYTNAGHNQPFLFRKDKTIKYLDKGGIPIGIFPKAAYETEEISLQAGDTIILYTDGITEAQNFNEAEFGQLQLEEIVTADTSLEPNDIIKNLISSLEQFKTGQKQNDDLTLLVIKRTE